MIQKVLTIENRAGIHARPSSLIVQTANSFKSDITFSRGNIQVNAKSIMGVISMAAAYQSKITVTIDGEDENEAMEAIERLFITKFEED